MRKIIPLIVLMLLSALFTNAQNIDQTEKKLSLYTIEANKAALGITAEQLKNAVVATSYEDVATRIRYVGLQQSFKGIPVYNQFLILSFRNDQLLSKAGSFDASIEKSVNVTSASPAVSAESAVQSALSDRGFRATQMAIPINRKDEGRFVVFGNMGISQENITAQLTWVPNEKNTEYRLAWQVYIIPKTTSDYWMVRVDAVNNSILGIDNYTDYDNWGNPFENAALNLRYPAFDYGNILISKTSDKGLFDFKKIDDDPSLVNTATYRVVPFPAESPGHPGGAPALRTDPWTAATANAQTLRWHTGATSTDYDYTRGNNVFAYHDRPNDNTGSPAEAATSTTAFPNLTFDFVPDFTMEPTVTSPPNQQWNITNLFYWNNIIHDVLYAYGFTEAGRNFQDDNLGRGGAGADWVRAEAQDGGGTNNANFSTPADGSLPRMQMYLWTAPTPDRDGDVDNGIIIHEYGHGVSNRSHSGGVGCLNNAEQAGEGWSDYLALMLTQDWATATLNTGFNSPRGVGTYALNQPNNGPGIRPTRYCTDFAVNSVTYANLPGQAVPHGVGYVFCSMLWEMTWELINHIGTITPNIYNTAGTGGNVVALKLVMEGLRTQQCAPGFVSARNAILRADTTLFGGIYFCPIMRAFARRGVGIGALEGSTSSITDQTPSFVGGGPAMSFTQNGAAGIPELQNIIYNHSITAACSAIANFTLRDTLPLNANFVSATNGGTYSGPPNRVVNWPVNVALNATQNYGLTVQIAAGSYFPPVTLINEPVPTTTISGFWTTSSTTANVWVAHNVRSHSAPNSFFTPDPLITSDQIIATTASFAIGATAPTLSFWHWYNTESPWDGGVLEISLNGGGSWGDIGSANFTQNGYNGTLNASANPLGGRAAWTGNSAAFVETKVNMTAYANQANVKLRWRLGADASVGAVGWNVDDIIMETRAVVNLRSSLFNASNVRVEIRDTTTIILPPASISPTVTINQAAAQPDPTSISPISFTVVFDQPVIGFATGDVVLTGTAGATTGVVTGGPTTFNVDVFGMTASGTVIASIPAGVCTNAALDPNLASTSTDNIVTYNLPPPPPACITTVSFTGPPVAIPDDLPAGVDIPITVAGVGTIADINFRLDPGAGTCDNTIGNTSASVDHTFNGDLIFTLTSPAATTVTLINRRGGSGNNFCLVTLDDDGSFPATSTMSTAGAITGNFAPENPLSAFDGQNANGTWILNVSDNAGVDIGSVRGFSLIITAVSPTMNAVPNDTVCAGSLHPAINFSSTMPGVTYAWTNNNPTIGLAASGTGNIAPFTATNAGVTPVTATITVTPQIGACSGVQRTFTITVNPAPLVNPVPNQVVCRGVATAPVNFTGSPASVIFQWTNNTPAIGLAAAGTGNIASFIAQNPGTTPLVATITVTPVTGLTTPVVTTFNFTGAVQTFVVPAGITSVNIKAWGAQGNSNALSVVGGLGGYAEGNLAVTPGQTLFINTGGGGATTINGGFNGGGAAGINAGCAQAQGGGGGGASDVRITANTLANRVLVAAGGGGAGANRVAGCGRGTGGGGGGGLYGGGGGAGWPGIPPGGPVPTGGTQSAGGAGGVTTFSPGPTNGFPGVLGIGGAGGTEIGSNQGGSATGESGGVGGGLIGAPGNYNPTNNWCGQSGAGGSSYIGGVTSGITTPGLRAGNGQVQITYTPPSATTCFGTPRTFTITVNPNPNIVIVADPGTVLCQGDPTLLTVRVGTSSPLGTLYNQTGVAGNGSPSQVFEPANAAFSSQAADDFTVPAGTTWTVTQITTLGIGAGVPTSVNVFFYANSAGNLPGAAIASFNNVATFVQAGSNYTVTLPSAVTLPAGTYWMSFQVNMSFATSGQWFWGNFGAANIGNEYAWQNPGGGFGTPCTSWGYGGTGCNVGGGPANRNNRFTIIGTSLADGGPLPGGYTFLWSPAAGLSSTTSNPVAASPFITTLYTVNVSTGAGCLNSASILITVNQRPTVTTQPVSRTNCAGTSATFTVAGTGTALTYQWQVSTAGCAGPWVNLANGGPYLGVNTAILTVNPVTTLMSGYAYRCVLGGTCAPVNNANISACAVLTVNPLPNVAITPAVACGGVAGLFGTMLSVGSAPPPVPGSVTVNSGAISIPIPDNTPNGVSSNLTVAGIPANATITGVRATWTMPHTWNGDMVFVLRSPNGSILNLDYYLSGTGGAGATTGFVNTVVSSAGTAALSTGTGTYTATFRADAAPAASVPVAGPTGFTPTVTTWPPMYTPIPNGTWTLAMYDGGPADLGTLTNWLITIDYTTPGTGGGPVLTYVWSPLAGLYTDAAAIIPYTGTNTPIVYAAPTVFTVYTVRATDVATGCFADATALVNYTPPAPTVTPNPVAMCLGDPAVRLTSSSSTTTTSSFTSGTISVPIPEGAFPTGPYNAGVSTIAVSGIPAAATISRINVRMNITHAFVGDVVAVLQAPNGQRINLDALLSATNNAGVNFVNTVISSAGGPLLSSGTAPWSSTFRADAVGATFTIFGFTLPGGPIGYIPTTQTWAPLMTTGAIATGNWTLALYDAGAPDIGTLTNWSIDIVHVLGVPATPAVWTPNGVGSGLFNDAAATIVYTGTPRDTVWARPTPAGVYPYQVTVQSMPPPAFIFSNPAPITINAAGNGTPYPSNLVVSGLPPSSVTVRSVTITGISHTWSEDVDILLQSPSGQNVILISDIDGAGDYANHTYTLDDAAPTTMAGAAPPPSGTYRPTNSIGAIGPEPDNWPAPGPGAVAQPVPTLSTFTGNMNGTWKLFVFDDAGGDAGSISGGYSINFNLAAAACTSPARTVVVTVNVPTTVTTQPVNQTVCTDKVATFTVVAGGSGPFSYQWQVSTNTGNTWTNITNGGVYSGATTATLTITAPPVTMSGYFYRAIITGAAPCAPATSFQVILTVNPLPTVVISASPYTSLFPGLVTTLSSTVSPAAASTYTWLRNGAVVPGAITGTLSVDVDGLGNYQLRVTDINGCTNISNIVTIKDSASGKCFLYPNPTSGKFQVRYHSAVNNSSLPRSLTVYDAKGDRVFTQMYTIGAPYDRMDVDMRAYGKGLYWVEIGDRNGNRLAMCRVVIQ